MDATAGRFPTGRQGLARDWDGHAWAPHPVPDPTAPEIAKGGRALLRTARFWVAVGLVLSGAAVAALASDQTAPDAWLAALGGAIACGGALIAMTLAVWQRLRIRAALDALGIHRYALIGLGVVSGVVAVVVAFTVEISIARFLGAGPITSLFLAGPIEESAKLLLPVIFFYATRKRLADPRVTFAIVWICGVVFGIFEGAEYLFGYEQGRPHAESHLASTGGAGVLTISRTFTEMLHPLLTGGAAAVMWLGAWRGRRLLVGSGLIAYLTAVALHSINDGVIGGLLREISTGLSLALWPVWLVLVYQVFRRHARELVPPSMIAECQHRWRPRAKLAGQPARRELQAARV